jgi:hypothetical protein
VRWVLDQEPHFRTSEKRSSAAPPLLSFAAEIAVSRHVSTFVNLRQNNQRVVSSRSVRKFIWILDRTRIINSFLKQALTVHQDVSTEQIASTSNWCQFCLSMEVDGELHKASFNFRPINDPKTSSL